MIFRVKHSVVSMFRMDENDITQESIMFITTSHRLVKPSCYHATMRSSCKQVLLYMCSKYGFGTVMSEGIYIYALELCYL